MHRQIARRQRQSVESFSLGRIWSEIPHMWKGAFYGFSVGVLAIAVIPLMWSSPWSLSCTAGSAVMLAIIGLFVGRAQGTRDSQRDLTREPSDHPGPGPIRRRP